MQGTDYILKLNSISKKAKIHDMILGEDILASSANEKQTRYDTGSGIHADALNRNKVTQRVACAKKMRQGGITLELFGGRGNLTQAVYSNFASKHILVEEDQEECVEASHKLGAKATVYNEDNIQFCETRLEGIGRIDLIDFDAFGTTVPAITAFFANYEIKHETIVTITDGYATHIHFKFKDPTALSDDLLQHGYPVIPKSGMNASVFFGHVLKTLMEHMGKKYNFSVEQINATTGKGINSGEHRQSGKNTLYTGYIIRPTKHISAQKTGEK